MRYFILLLFLLAVLACENSQTKQKNRITTCQVTATDFLKLKDSVLQKELFFKIDSFSKNVEEKDVFIDLTPEYLNQFLSDIKIDSLKLNNAFEKEYHFNRAPKEFSDLEICKDKISLTFEPDACYFRLIVFNEFFVSDADFCAESDVVYTFRIFDNRIVGLNRSENG